MDPLTAAAIASGVLKLGGKIFGGISAKKKLNEQNRAATASMTLAQKRAEDQRRARLALANGLLSGVPATTAGGGVNTNVGLDPALFAQLDRERTYDFGSTLPKHAGGVYGFLGGLFEGAADIAPYMMSGGANAAARGGNAVPGTPSGAPAIDLDELRALGKTSATTA